GRLRHFYDSWRKITKNPIILSWVRGYKIPFFARPFQPKEPVPRSWTDEEFLSMQGCVSDLLAKGAVRRCSICPGQFISDIFLVPKPDGSSRFILNLKELNLFIRKSHFKLEDFR